MDLLASIFMILHKSHLSTLQECWTCRTEEHLFPLGSQREARACIQLPLSPRPSQPNPTLFVKIMDRWWYTGQSGSLRHMSVIRIHLVFPLRLVAYRLLANGYPIPFTDPLPKPYSLFIPCGRFMFLIYNVVVRLSCRLRLGRRCLLNFPAGRIVSRGRNNF